MNAAAMASPKRVRHSAKSSRFSVAGMLALAFLVAAAPRPMVLGGSIHECGTARMSERANDGVLNSFCQTHDIPNLYVFGGNAFPSTGDKHPTLTFMALTARAANYAVQQMKAGTI